MLSDIQAMIVDYKKKSHYSNLVTNHDTETGDDEARTTVNDQASKNEAIAGPASRLAQTSKTGEIFEA